MDRGEYEFYHEDGRTFCGTQRDFRRENSSVNTTLLVRGKTVHGWRVRNPADPVREDPPYTETRGQRNVCWIERRCFVPEGAQVGRPVQLMPWQRQELLR